MKAESTTLARQRETTCHEEREHHERQSFMSIMNLILCILGFSPIFGGDSNCHIQ